MATRKGNVKDADALVAAWLAAPNSAARARIINMEGKPFRTVSRSLGVYVSGKLGDDARAFTEEHARALLTRPSIIKHATDAGYTL